MWRRRGFEAKWAFQRGRTELVEKDLSCVRPEEQVIRGLWKTNAETTTIEAQGRKKEQKEDLKQVLEWTIKKPDEANTINSKLTERERKKDKKRQRERETQRGRDSDRDTKWHK